MVGRITKKRRKKVILSSSKNKENSKNKGNMADIITFLRFLQKLEQGRLIPTEQIEHLADILESTLRKNLSNGLYDSLNKLLENQLNSNEQNTLFIDILTPNPEKDTLTKLIEFLNDQFKDFPSGPLDDKYELDFKVPSKDKEYIEIYKDSDHNYILKYANISDYSKNIYTIPLIDLNWEDINTIWDAIQEMNSNE